MREHQKPGRKGTLGFALVMRVGPPNLMRPPTPHENPGSALETPIILKMGSPAMLVVGDGTDSIQVALVLSTMSMMLISPINMKYNSIEEMIQVPM